MVKEALRKNSLNVDLHIHALEDPITGMDAGYDLQYKHLLDILGSAILKGLDIIGIVSRYSYEPGNLCKQIIQEKKYDILCLSGFELKSSEGINIIAYESQKIPPTGLSIDKLCHFVHDNKGIVMAIQPSRRNVQKLNKIVGTKKAPDFIEIFNDITQGGYNKSFIDTSPHPDFQLVMNSAARNAKDLDMSMMVTRVPRKFLIKKGILKENEGVDFVPQYLDTQQNTNKYI